MEPNFQVETKHTQQTYQHMVSAHFMRHKKNSIVPLYILMGVLALGVWYLAAEGDLFSIGALGTGLFTLAAGTLLVPTLDRISARNVCKRLCQTTVKAVEKQRLMGIPVRYRFYPDTMESAGEDGTVDLGYDLVNDLVDSKIFYLVFLENGQCVAVDKTHFTLGDPDQFPAFMAEKTGKTWASFEVPKGRYAKG